jgi:hypothetical protein
MAPITGFGRAILGKIQWQSEVDEVPSMEYDAPRI